MKKYNGVNDRKNLKNEVLENLRPLYNSNVAKVSIVKWSQN